jgi:urease subunit gamma/beta
MRLTPFEEDRLLVFAAAELARRRRAAGLSLNHPEAVALIADAMFEAARAGATYEAVEAAGRNAVSAEEVLPGVRALVDEVRVEVLFGDGTRLVVLVDPLGDSAHGTPMGPGAVIADREPTDPMEGRERRMLEVRNDSRRVVVVSSHQPFDLVNPRLTFDRAATAGFRLDLASGATERWEPGETRVVTLVRYAGRIGFEALGDR